MPKSLEPTDIDANIETLPLTNSDALLERNLSVTTINSASSSAAASAAAPLGTPTTIAGKKYRHQNYSKNIYIGTKNAEKWEITRTKLSFKNDVEFVSYLLALAENDFLNNDGRIHHHDGSGATVSNSFPIHLEQNLNEKYHPAENVGKSSDNNCVTTAANELNLKVKLPKRAKKVVQFHERHNGSISNNSAKSLSAQSRHHITSGFSSHRKIEQQVTANFSVLNQNSQDAQDNSISSTVESTYSPTIKPNLPEVLDCRIAEKIKNELQQKLGAIENEFFKVKKSQQQHQHEQIPEALCLATTKDASTERLTIESNYPVSVIKIKKKSTKLNERKLEKFSDNEHPKKKSKNKTKKFDIRKAPLPIIDTAPLLNDCNNENEYGGNIVGNCFNNKLDDDSLNNYRKLNDIEDDDDDDEDDVDNDEDEDGDDNVEDDYNDFESDDEQLSLHDEPIDDDDPDEIDDQDPIKANNCSYCDADHMTDTCLVRQASKTISDAIDFEKWMERKRTIIEKEIKKEDERENMLGNENNEDSRDDNESQLSNQQFPDEQQCFAALSLPEQFELRTMTIDATTSSMTTTGIFARNSIEMYTKLGPLIGVQVPEVDMPDDCSMQYVFETFDGTKSTYYLMDDPNKSNWMRYVRPASTRNDRNLTVVRTESGVYFVTCKDIVDGCELLYWSDDCNSAWGKKKISKMNCGGCNLKFSHPLYYRTHCSIFHDPFFSLTIRRYHCKICGIAVLGKENIMKHAAQMHDGKGAYQCQFCKKFFLRLNYLEMHRTYGCSANPQRARPLCDFCGRKFCQPQKLKVHIKRMHSDMADVLRDFQCKLCSKLLGSRAALQRHSKEVHSRNSAVVGCPRCQKLFQNRSNLKIHMLTHSGVRPFKCIEGECNAAFTTKQCLQFHYKKVHSYAQEQMPKIERSVAYTFDAYSGGMKVEHLEQAPRRRRKSLDDGSVMQDNRSETEFSEDNGFDNVKKSGKSISNLCKNEPNLSLLSSRISSILEQGIKIHRKHRERKAKPTKSTIVGINETQVDNFGRQSTSMDMNEANEMELNNKAQDEFLQNLQQKRQQQKQLSLIESFLSSAASSRVAAAAAAAAIESDHLDVEQPLPTVDSNLDITENHEDHYKTPMEDDMKIRDLRMTQGQNTGQNIIASKGSRKWISSVSNSDCREDGGGSDNNEGDGIAEPVDGNGDGDDDDDEDDDDDLSNKLTQPNRDFLSRLMMNGAQNDDDDENSSFLDVVDTHHNNVHSGVTGTSTAALPHYNNSLHNNVINSLPQLPHLSSMPHLHSQSFMGSYYNNNSTANRNVSTSASMLVEAALSSVGNMISDDSDISSVKHTNNNNNNNDSHMDGHNDHNNITMDVDIASTMHDHEHSVNQSPVSVHENRFTSAGIHNLENELKLMKNLNSFPLQPLPHQYGSNSVLSAHQTPTHHLSPDETNLPNENDIDVDTASTPKTIIESAADKIYRDTDGQNFVGSVTGGNHHNTPPTPHILSPGREYTMYNANLSSPLSGQMSSTRRNYTNEHDLISPATSPALPHRYGNFRMSDLCRKRDIDDHVQNNNLSANMDSRHSNQHHNISSDEENSIIAQNLSMSGSAAAAAAAVEEMRMKFNPSQIDLMYSKYENGGIGNNNSGSADISDIRSKYMDQSAMEVQNFRVSGGGGGGGADTINDMQVLDMTARNNLSGFHPNFQLNAANSNNLNLGRYHHHIYDILSEREQQQQQQQHQQQQEQQQQNHQQQHQQQHQQEQHHQSQDNLQHSQIHHLMQDQMANDADDQTTSVDLSRSATYAVTPPPPSLSYTHSHSDMLRMASLDAAIGGNRNFLSPQMQHNSRESLDYHRYLSTSDQHRLLSSNGTTAEQLANHRLLVDPAAHLLMEQNSKLLQTADQPSRLLADSTSNRHMVSPRGFGAYHQVSGASSYHHTVRQLASPPNHHAVNPSNYHPFPSYY